MSEFWFKNDSNGQNFNIKMTLVDWSWTKNYSSEQVLNFFDVLADKYSPESSFVTLNAGDPRQAKLPI